MTSGIYAIVNVADGKQYIGSSIDLKKRWRRHLSCLRRGKHHSPHLQRAFAKCGSAAFEFRVLEFCDGPALIDREQAAMDALQPEYNVLRFAGSRLGAKQSPETRQKRREAMLGKKCGPPSAETRRKIADAQRGRKRGPYKPRTAEHSAAIAAALRGRTFGPRKKTQKSSP